VSVKVVARHGTEVRHVADDFVVIRMNAKRRLLHRLSELKERLILAPLPLGNDDRAFGGDFLLVELAVDHAVGFEAQGKVDPVGRHGLVIRGPIEVGHGVPHAAFARDGFIEHAGRELRRAFELHMLDPMRDAGAPLHFIARADAVPQPRGNDRRGVDLLEENLQPVRQGLNSKGFFH
jgi:hypothetical protein